MKAFKITDCIGQILLIGGSLIYNFLPIGFDEVWRVNEGFLFSYLLVGTWQIISLIVHFFISAEYKIGLRRIYSVLLLVTGGLFLIGLFSTDLLLGLFFGLLFWSPALAILYLITCLLELRKVNTVMS